MTNDAKVKFLYTEWFDCSKMDTKDLKALKKKLDKSQTSKTSKDDDYEICLLLGAFFVKSDKDPHSSDVKNLREFFSFPKSVDKEL